MDGGDNMMPPHASEYLSEVTLAAISQMEDDYIKKKNALLQDLGESDSDKSPCGLPQPKSPSSPLVLKSPHLPFGPTALDGSPSSPSFLNDRKGVGPFAPKLNDNASRSGGAILSPLSTSSLSSTRDTSFLHSSSTSNNLHATGSIIVGGRIGNPDDMLAPTFSSAKEMVTDSGITNPVIQIVSPVEEGRV